MWVDGLGRGLNWDLGEGTSNIPSEQKGGSELWRWQTQVKSCIVGRVPHLGVPAAFPGVGLGLPTCEMGIKSVMTITRKNTQHVFRVPKVGATGGVELAGGLPCHQLVSPTAMEGSANVVVIVGVAVVIVLFLVLAGIGFLLHRRFVVGRRGVGTSVSCLENGLIVISPCPGGCEDAVSCKVLSTLPGAPWGLGHGGHRLCPCCSRVSTLPPDSQAGSARER